LAYKGLGTAKRELFSKLDYKKQEGVVNEEGENWQRERSIRHCAKQLAKITSGFPSHVNIIRLNEVKENNYRAPSVDE